MNQPEWSWLSDTRARLAQRRGEKPATKAGQVRALWPEIEAALRGGQSMKSIRKWLEEDAGIRLGLTSLTSYIRRIRRREAAAASSARQTLPMQRAGNKPRSGRFISSCRAKAA
jgi:hypothetical protein